MQQQQYDARTLSNDAVLEAIQSVERRLSPDFGICPTKRLYARHQSVHCSALGAVRDLLPFQKNPTPVERSTLLATLLRGEKALSNIAADYVILRNNIRLFYTRRPRQYAVKIYARHSGREQALTREVSIRKRIAQNPTMAVKTPEMYQIECETSPPFIVEAYLAGRTASFSRDQGLLLSLVDAMFQLYRFFGIQCKPISELFSESACSAVDELLEHAPNAYGLTPPSWSRKGMQEVLHDISANGAVPCSVCHGSFALSNILLTEDGPVILDWEAATSDKPLVFDLLRLLRKLDSSSETFRGRYIERIDRNLARLPGDPGDVLSARHQAALYELSALTKTAAEHKQPEKNPDTVRKRMDRSLKLISRYAPEYFGYES